MSMTATQLMQPLSFSFDLKDGLVQQPLRMQLMQGDKRANRVILTITEDRKPVALESVTAAGSFIRPDGGEILLDGSIEDGKAVVTIKDACYSEEGHFELNVTLTVGEVRRTVLAVTGYVLKKGNGTILDVEDVIPSVQEIIAQYAEMQRVTKETQEAADAARSFADARVTATTLPAGSAATVTRTTGEDGVQEIAYGIPRGEPGADGEPGQDGAPGPIGPQGPQGPAGEGLKILGLYSTLAALQAAHPTGSAGEAYAVGTSEDNEIYIWDVDGGAWKNLGALQGPPGPQGNPGNPGVTPHIGVNGNWFIGNTDTGIPATGPVGPEGPQGDDYSLTDADKQDIAGMLIDNDAASANKTYSSEKIDEALDKLEKEKADKTEIPAPYSLPTASATVKGGVMVGNGLAIDENGVLYLNIPSAAGVSF